MMEQARMMEKFKQIIDSVDQGKSGGIVKAPSDFSSMIQAAQPAAETELTAKIDRAIELDQAIKSQKKELDRIKADLQTMALGTMENKNVKFVQMFGNKGRFEAAYKEKLEIDNYHLLIRTLGDIVIEKVTMKTEPKFDIENRFKAALTSLVKSDYGKHDLPALLAGMGLDGKAIKVALKKLKGDYKADRKTLASLGVTGEREEELDAIREAKNLELIERFVDPAAVDRSDLLKSLFLEESLSVALSYDADGEA